MCEREVSKVAITPLKANPRGKLVGSRQNLMIINLYKTKMLQQPTLRIKEIVKIISKELGIGQRTTQSTIAEYKSEKTDITVTSHREAFVRGLSTGAPNPTAKGKRLIVVNIGSEEGFIDGGLLVFESKKGSADYHEEMNGDVFFDWLKDVIPLLKDNSILVMENAPYHSVKSEKCPIYKSTQFAARKERKIKI
ncbi:hypothetical protein QTP88_021708 [Uroleucon formosanum]